MTVRFQMDLKGMAEYLEAIARAGQDVDAAAAKAVSAGGQVLLDAMLVKVPKDTRNLMANLELTEPQQDGNFIFVEVGLSKAADDDTARYGNVQEYGSAVMEAQSYLRPAFDEKKRQVRAAEKAALIEAGMLPESTT